MVTNLHWLSLVVIGYHWLSLVIIGCHWSSLVIIGYHWLSLARNTFGLVARPGEVFEGPDAVIQHGVFRETSERNIARIANAVLATLFKGHNVIVNI